MPRNRIHHGRAFGFGLTMLLATASAAASATSPGPRLTADSAQASSKIAFTREPLNSGYDGVLYVMNADGSGQRRLAPANPAMRWSPGGQKIAFVDNSQVYVMNVDGSAQTRLTSPLLGECDGRARWDTGLAWSPDGRAIAFTRRFCGLGRYSEIYAMNADGSEQRRLTRITAPRQGELTQALHPTAEPPSALQSADVAIDRTASPRLQTEHSL
jgi:Tol biopolymer transport system component